MCACFEYLCLFSKLYLFKIGKLETGPGSSHIVSTRGLLCLIKEIAKEEMLHRETDECAGELSQHHPVCGQASQDQV